MWFRWSLLWREWWDGWDWALQQHPATSEDQFEQNSWAQVQIVEETERIMVEKMVALHSLGFCSVFCWFLRVCLIYSVLTLGCRKLLPMFMLMFGPDFQPGGRRENWIRFHPVSLLESLTCQRSQWDGTVLFDLPASATHWVFISALGVSTHPLNVMCCGVPT